MPWLTISHSPVPPTRPSRPGCAASSKIATRVLASCSDDLEMLEITGPEGSATEDAA